MVSDLDQPQRQEGDGAAFPAKVMTALSLIAFEIRRVFPARGKSASNLLRGDIVGSGGYAIFFTVVGAMLTTLGIAMTCLLALLVAIGVGAATFSLSKKSRIRIAKS